jgi:hypothetical protein
VQEQRPRDGSRGGSCSDAAAHSSLPKVDPGSRVPGRDALDLVGHVCHSAGRIARPKGCVRTLRALDSASRARSDGCRGNVGLHDAAGTISIHPLRIKPMTIRIGL